MADNSSEHFILLYRSWSIQCGSHSYKYTQANTPREETPDCLNRCCLPNVTLIEYKTDERDKPKLFHPNCPPTPHSNRLTLLHNCFYIHTCTGPSENVSVLSEQVWPFLWWSVIATNHTFYFVSQHAKTLSHTQWVLCTPLHGILLKCSFLQNFHTSATD